MRLFASIPVIALFATGIVDIRLTAGTRETAKTSPTATRYEDFGLFAPLPQRLEKQPDRAKELAWVIDCRDRLQGKAGRTESSERLIARFRKNFDPAKVAPETAITFATLVTRLRDAMSPEDADTAMRMLSACPAESRESLSALHQWTMGTLYSYIVTGDRALRQVNFKKALGERFLKKYRNEWSTPATQRLLLGLLGDDEPDRRLRLKDRARRTAFFEQLAALPDASLTSEIGSALGRYYKGSAWDARGSAYASKTTREQFDAFATILPKATTYYTKALTLDRRNKEAYEGLMTIAMADASIAGAPVDRWMKKARTAGVVDGKTLHRYAFTNALRWGGNPKAILLAYTECVSSADTDHNKARWAPDIMAELIKDTEDKPKAALRHQAALDYVAIANRIIDADNKTGVRFVDETGQLLECRARAVALLADAGMAEKASALSRYTDDPRRENDPTGKTVDKYRDAPRVPWAYLLAVAEIGNDSWLKTRYPELVSGTEAPAPAQDAWHQDPRAVSEYAATLAAVATQTKSRVAGDAIEALRAVNTAETAFLAEKTAVIPLMPDAWIRVAGFHQSNGDRMIDVRRTAPYARHFAVSRIRLTPPYELNVRIRIDPGSTQAHAGVVVGDFATGRTGRAFVLEGATGTSRVMAPGKAMRSAAISRPNRVDNHKAINLRIRIFPHGYSIKVNDEPAIGSRDDTFVAGNIGLGSMPGFTCYGRFEYSDFTACKITPAGMGDDERTWMDPAKPSAPATPAATTAGTGEATPDVEH